MRKRFFVFISSILLTICFLFLCGFSKPDNTGDLVLDNGSDIYFVGDSRTFFAYNSIADNRVNWLAACGTRYDYFAGRYLPMLDAVNKKGKTIVIFYGVNDVMQSRDIAVNNWLTFLLTYGKKWEAEGADVIMCNVPGVDYELCESSTVFSKETVDIINSNINSFNDIIRDSCPDEIEWLNIRKLYNCPDGIHYCADDYSRIYKGLIDQLVIRNFQRSVLRGGN